MMRIYNTVYMSKAHFWFLYKFTEETYYVKDHFSETFVCLFKAKGFYTMYWLWFLDIDQNPGYFTV